ncbi:hypothetical protein E2C04_07875 [Nocardioides daphniae]|uniref:Metal-dependent phosphohydrolase n=1 Tax=Nocardioides daphniae TaxID=402297 RepID=A0A4V1CWW4_9ACTN|nr:hypothetical protein E2C04_07875 [Nocardioides daphniae]
MRDALLRAYGEPRRGYHDLQHLREVLERLDELASHAAFDLATVQLAAWFHDAVHDADPDPEGRSADWADRALTAHPRRAEVVRLVLMTRDHDPAPGDAEAEALCDADLAILAAPAARYQEYVAGVRRDYASVPDGLFRLGRAEVLRTLLAHPTLFRTAYAREAWEARARANVQGELERLTAPSASDDAGPPDAAG